jgi:hypothetical protein
MIGDGTQRRVDIIHLGNQLEIGRRLQQCSKP